MIETLIPFLIFIIIGYLAKITKLLKEEDNKILTSLVMKIFLPIVIFVSFAKLEFEFILLKTLFVSILMILFMFLISIIIAKLLKLNEKTKKAFIITFSSMWGATLGVPFVLLHYGEFGFVRMVIFDLINTLCILTVLNFVASSKEKNLKSNILNLRKNHLIIALVLGILFNIFGLYFSLLDNIKDICIPTTIALRIIVAGYYLDFKLNNFKLPLVLVSLKMIVGFSLAYVFTTLFQISGISQKILLIAGVLPVPLVMMAYSQEYNLNNKFTSATISLGLIISLVLMSLITLI